MPGSNISYPISEGGQQTQLLTRHATDTRDVWTQSYYGAQKLVFEGHVNIKHNPVVWNSYSHLPTSQVSKLPLFTKLYTYRVIDRQG